MVQRWAHVVNLKCLSDFSFFSFLKIECQFSLPFYLPRAIVKVAVLLYSLLLLRAIHFLGQLWDRQSFIGMAKNIYFHKIVVWSLAGVVVSVTNLLLLLEVHPWFSPCIRSRVNLNR